MHGRNRHVSHSLNVMLNYVYVVLESQVRIAGADEGLNSTIGYLHTCRSGRATLVFHLMDLLRPQVVRFALNFVRSHRFRESDFVLRHSGVCKLHSTRLTSNLTSPKWYHRIGISCSIYKDAKVAK